MWWSDSIEQLHHDQFEATRCGRVVALNAWTRDPRRDLADQVEAEVKARLEAAGYYVSTTSHKAHYDLLACRDDGVARVEVKAATWSSGRYSFQLRGNRADVLVLCCRDGSDHYFVIPFNQVDGLTFIKITSHDPTRYVGKWLKYLEAWTLIDEIVSCANNPFQLALGGNLWTP